jgi:hypothetical protein
VGDIVAVSVPSEARQRYGYPPTVVHRVVNVTPAGVITTKGDARPKPDPFTTKLDAVRARVVWTIPAAGQVVAFLTSTMGLIWLAAGVLMLVALPLFERQRDAREAEQETLSALRDELRGMSGELAALREAALWQRAPEPDAEPEAPEPVAVAVASLEMERWSAEAEAFNFHIDWSVLPDLDSFATPKLLANPEPTPEPPLAPVVVNRRSGGLVGAMGRFARSRRYS